jgi:tripartite-type tricarboxylate transporter receptor subunit TctC
VYSLTRRRPATDITARLIGQWLSDRLGQQLLIENRSGAGTNIATEAVVHATATRGKRNGCSREQ